jgi:hypothetical protein
VDKIYNSIVLLGGGGGERDRLGLSENLVLEKTLGPKRREVKRAWLQQQKDDIDQ